MTNKFYIALSHQRAMTSYAVLKYTNNLIYEVETGDIPYVANEAYEFLTKYLTEKSDADNLIFKYQSKEIATHMGNIFNNDEFYKGRQIKSSPAIFPNDFEKQNKAFQILTSYIWVKDYKIQNYHN